MTSNINAAKRFLNGDLIYRKDLFVRLLLPEYYFRVSAKRFCIPVNDNDSSGSAETVELENYDGSDPCVTRLKAFIDKESNGEIVSILLHGSIATGDVIPYSDFDAVAVIRDDTLSDPVKLARMARTLYIGRKYFHEFDSLQHHGWMIFTESELRNRTPLPLSLLKSARVITGSTRISVSAENHLPKGNINRIRSQISDLIRTDKFPTTKFSLKSILSEFMLTPVLYLQERYGLDISKKESFETARTDFDPDEYAIMDEVSAIRSNWRPDVSSWRSYLMKKLRFLPGATAGKLSGRVPQRVLNCINKDFQQRMVDLLDSMEQKISEAS